MRTSSSQHAFTDNETPKDGAETFGYLSGFPEYGFIKDNEEAPCWARDNKPL